MGIRTHTDIGDLNQSIEIVHFSESKTADLGVRKEPTPYTIVWAEIKNLSAFERQLLGRQETTDTKRVTMRYRNDIDATMGFRWLNGNGQLFKFTGFPEKVGNKNFFMTIDAEGLHDER